MFLISCSVFLQLLLKMMDSWRSDASAFLCVHKRNEKQDFFSFLGVGGGGSKQLEWTKSATDCFVLSTAG